MPDVSLTTIGERLTISWTQAQVALTFDRWQRDKESITAELTITTSAPGYKSYLTSARLNLTSLQTRQQWGKRLTEMFAHAEWTAVLEESCARALKHYRGGEPVQRLSPAPLGAGPSWRVQPLLYEKLPTVIFGPGGSRKSFLGLWLALMVEAGATLLGGVGAVQGRALYLDWESDADIAEYRMGRFIDGNPDLEKAQPSYRRMKQSLSGDLPALSAMIAEEAIDLVIVDSLAMACGGKDLADPSTAVSYFSALRQLPCTSLSIAHVPKNTENPTIYGSVFFTNIARMTWEIKCDTDEQDGSSTIGLFNRKANERRHTPIGLKFAHDAHSQAITVSPTTLTETEAFFDTSPLWMKLQHYCQEGAKTTKTLAELTGKSFPAVYNELERMEKKDRILRLGEGKGTEWVAPPIQT